MAFVQTADEVSRALGALAGGRNADPFAVLGPHLAEIDGGRAVAIRVYRPAARQVAVVRRDRPAATATAGEPELVPMRRRSPDGVFEAIFPDETTVFDYGLQIAEADGRVIDADDPYRFGRVLSDFDEHLFGEGRHTRLYDKLGAHPLTLGSTRGFHFAVWAPNAERVSVIGDFNGWDGRVHPMRTLGSSGLWEIFLPGLGEGERYKFEIRSRHGGALVTKADPFAFAAELPPRTASLTWEGGRYEWGDAEWMRAREAKGGWLAAPMTVYEVHLGSWARVAGEGDRFLTYRELAGRLIPYVKVMGFTHLELLPVMEHPFAGSWGYQVTGYFAPTSRFGSPDDFRYFVDECHRHGIGVILDWVPGHFPKDAYGLARFDGTGLYEHEDPRQGEHREWGTLIFNYDRHEVRNFLIANALFWLREFHVDGLRVDAVASMLYLDYSRNEGEWLPNRYGGRENLGAIELLRDMNALTHTEAPGSVTVAEESTAWPAVSRPVYLGGLGFTLKWNMGWMHDILEYCRHDPVHRRWAHAHLTFSMLYAFTENFVLPFSHDEVVHGKGSMANKMPGDAWQKMATLRALYGFMYSHPGKKLLFMGSEFGQWREWNYDHGLDWHLLDEGPFHAGVRQLVRDLNTICRREPALFELDFDPAGFQWIDCTDNEHSVVSYLRRARDPLDFIVGVVNFTPVPRHAYRIGVPEPGFYRELLNSDSELYGGSNLGNAGGVTAEPVPAHGHAWSLSLTVPPLACLWLKVER